MTPEDKYNFIDHSHYKCIKCGMIVDDRLRHIDEYHHNSFSIVKKK